MPGMGTTPYYDYSPATGTGQYSTLQYSPSLAAWPSSPPQYYDGCSGHSGSNPQGGFTGCPGSLSTFVPTDYAQGLGFYNFGTGFAGFYASQTFHSQNSAGSGYLNLPVDGNDSGGNHIKNMLALLGSSDSAPADYLNEASYMSCSHLSSPNTSFLDNSTTPSAPGCGHIINAGLTPTWGTLQSALQYFNGSFKNPDSSTTLSSPIKYPCQKNFIVLVTDGVPDTDLSGHTVGSASVMPGVLSQIDAFQCPPSGATAANCKVLVGGIKYPVPVYVLGMGLQATDQANLNAMAAHGGTAIGGRAYSGDDATSFMNALYGIFNNIVAQTGSGSAASILNNSQGSGSTVLQAVFYPSKVFDQETLSQAS